jgi:mercuric reductase
MNPIRYRMDVAGMSCAHCELTVSRALERAGAQDARASFQHGVATFDLPDDISPDKLRTSVASSGYRPGDVTPMVTSRPTVSFQPSSGENYDLAILGAGSAAFAAAIKARGLGARVVMIERDTVGGTCVNIGCVPSKMLLRAGETYYHAAHHAYQGVETAAVAADYGHLISQKNDLVARMRREKYSDLVDEYGWDFVHGETRFQDEATISVNGQPVRAGAYLVATGARPTVPPIPGLAEAGYLTSTTAMEIGAVPSSVAVIGAGYIALELGQVFRHLGSDVTLIQRRPQLLPEYEPEVAEAVEAMLARVGTRVLTGSLIQRVERFGSVRRLHVERGGHEEVVEAEKVLVATGRRPNVESLDLAKAGIELDTRGAPQIDEFLRTTNRRVWAAGDVTLAPQFVYVAAYEGNLAAGNALNDIARPLDLTAVPSVTFTEPQIATVGLTRVQAETRGYAVKSAALPATIVPRAQVNYDTEGAFVLVADAKSDQLLGVQVVASNAGEVIYVATLAVRHKLTVADLVQSFAPYLTMAEGLKLGAIAFDRDVTKLSCCA